MINNLLKALSMPKYARLLPRVFPGCDLLELRNNHGDLIWGWSEQQDEKEEEEQGQGADPQQAQQPAGPQTVDPAQLLQEVRDREAQRRREREGRGSAKYETVERDW